ncbi:MAG: NUDIX hydrolase [Nitrososphaerales archaeon]
MGEKDFQSKVSAQIEEIKAALLSKPGRKASGEQFLPQAAVAIILRPDNFSEECEILVIKRETRENDPWSGHMAFPGGHYEESDEMVLTTAIREALEETGIDLRNCSMLGTLDEVIPTNRAIRVTPYVVLAPESTSVNIDGNEVAGYFWIPISFFRNLENSRPYILERLGTRVPSFLFKEKYVIWGMTHRMIADFLAKVYGR